MDVYKAQTRTIFITIADPVAHFVVDTTQGCHPFTIQTDTTAISSNGIYTWIVY